MYANKMDTSFPKGIQRICHNLLGNCTASLPGNRRNGGLSVSMAFRTKKDREKIAFKT